MQPDALMTWQPQHQLRFITLSQHNRGFLLLLFMLAAKLPRASTNTEQGLELLVKSRQWGNRCDGRYQGDFGNIYSGAHHSAWRKLKYKMGIEKLASGTNWIIKDNFKKEVICRGPWRWNQVCHREKEATGRTWREVWYSQRNKLGDRTAAF